FTCPMHPEVEQLGPGDCPLCGMALEPKGVSLDDSAADAEVRDMTRRLVVSALLTVPLVSVVMADMLPGHPVSSVLGSRGRAFLELGLALPVCTWAAWPF